MKHLGKSNKNFDKPSIKILDKIKNKEKENFLIRFSQPEFTCICPVTSQPDFAHIVIDYVPNKWIIESKSLKLYFQKENPAVRIRRSGERLVAIGHACRNLPVIIRKHITRETPCLQDSQKWRLRLPLDLTIPVTHFFAT